MSRRVSVPFRCKCTVYTAEGAVTYCRGNDARDVTVAGSNSTNADKDQIKRSHVFRNRDQKDSRLSSYTNLNKIKNRQKDQNMNVEATAKARFT